MNDFPQTLSTPRLILRQPCEGLAAAMASFEIRYHNDYRHTGKGYATEALQAILRLPVLQGKKVVAHINKKNSPSIKLAHNLGFQKEVPIDDFNKYTYIVPQPQELSA